MAKTLWREITITFTIWLLLMYTLDSVLHGFVSIIMPLNLLGIVWVANLILLWYYQRR
ncbi:MAG: hypothetical protein WCV88_04965 [Patescibacteria group bacterium]|jgi:hypothetical protein